MDYDQLRGDLYELIPNNWEHTQKLLRYIDEVEHNSKHIPSEIYNPKEEIKSFLTTIEDPSSAWMQKALALFA